MLRAVLDTNVILSGIAYPGSIPGKIVQAWQDGALEIYLSAYILGELRRVLIRLRHRHGMNEQEMDDFVDILSFQAELLTPAPVVNEELRDFKDQPVLGTLIAAMERNEATYLISGDKDLLVLRKLYPIISPAEFWHRHGLEV
jgi:putative PIN family toxin of toxin-antitoxin system